MAIIIENKLYAILPKPGIENITISEPKLPTYEQVLLCLLANMENIIPITDKVIF